MKRLQALSLFLGCLTLALSCQKEEVAKSTIDYLKEDYKTIVKEIPDADGYFI